MNYSVNDWFVFRKNLKKIIPQTAIQYKNIFKQINKHYICKHRISTWKNQTIKKS